MDYYKGTFITLTSNYKISTSNRISIEYTMYAHIVICETKRKTCIQFKELTNACFENQTYTYFTHVSTLIK